MNSSIPVKPMPPLDGTAVQKLEDALSKSPRNAILVKIGNVFLSTVPRGKLVQIRFIDQKKNDQTRYVVSNFNGIIQPGNARTDLADCRLY